MPNNDVVAALALQVGASTVKLRTEMDAAAASTRAAARQMRADMMEAKGAVAVLGEEVGVHLSRHLRNFVVELPGVATAMSAAFNVIAVAGLIGIVVEAGRKVAEFAEKNREAARKIEQTWRGITEPLRQSNDELRLTNDRLADSIAKFEHKPQNRLKEAIDEAAVAADRLSQKLDADLDKISAATKATSVGFLGELMGQAPTGDLEKKWLDLQARIQEAKDTGSARIHAVRATGNAEALKQAQADMDAKLKSLFDEGNQFFSEALSNAVTARQAQRDSAAGKVVPQDLISGWNSQNMDARVRLSSSMASWFGMQADQLGLSAQNRDLGSRNRANQGASDASRDRLQVMQEDLAKRKALYGDSLLSERAFWTERISQFSASSAEYAQILRRMSELEGQYFNQVRQRAKESRTLEFSNLPENVSHDTGKDYAAYVGRYSAEWRDYNNALAENVQMHARLQSALDATFVRLRAQSGAIERDDAALRIARIELATYRAQQEAIVNQARGVASDSSLSDVQRGTQLQQLQNKLDEITGQAAVKQAETDALAKSMQLRDAMGAMFSEWILKAQDVKSQLATLWEQFSGSMNGAMAQAIMSVGTRQRTDFAGAFRGVGDTATKFALSHVESMIMPHIPGLAKLMGDSAKLGTSGNPMWVRLADMPGTGIAGTGSIAGLFAAHPPKVVMDGAAAGPLPGMPAGGGPAGSGIVAPNGWAGAIRTIGGFLGIAASAARSGAGGAAAPDVAPDTSLDNYQIPYEQLQSYDFSGRAFGGSVLAGVPYNVGEMGTERFVPKTDGYIVPHHAMRDGGAYYEIHAEGADAAAIQQRVGRALEQVHGSAVQNSIAVQRERSRRIPSNTRNF